MNCSECCLFMMLVCYFCKFKMRVLMFQFQNISWGWCQTHCQIHPSTAYGRVLGQAQAPWMLEPVCMKTPYKDNLPFLQVWLCVWLHWNSLYWSYNIKVLQFLYLDHSCCNSVWPVTRDTFVEIVEVKLYKFTSRRRCPNFRICLRPDNRWIFTESLWGTV